MLFQEEYRDDESKYDQHSADNTGLNFDERKVILSSLLAKLIFQAPENFWLWLHETIHATVSLWGHDSEPDSSACVQLWAQQWSKFACTLTVDQKQLMRQALICFMRINEDDYADEFKKMFGSTIDTLFKEVFERLKTRYFSSF